MEPFKHFILTRFNLKIDEWKKDKRGIKLNTQSWLNHRIKLFEQFCYPSIQNQTNQNFKWLVCFDKSTSKKYHPLIMSYQKKYKNFIPLFTDSQHWLPDMRSSIGRKMEYLITTRIDNDDAFHKEVVNIIQKNFNKQKFEFLNLLKGYILYKDKLDYAQEDSNMFVSLTEKKRKQKSFKTIFGCGNHTDLRKLGPIRQIITKKPCWLRVIHERNLYRDKPIYNKYLFTARAYSFTEIIKKIPRAIYNIIKNLHRLIKWQFFTSPYDSPLNLIKRTSLSLNDIRNIFLIK